MNMAKRPTCPQLISWLLVLISTIGLFTTIVPLIRPPSFYIVTILYSFSLCAVLYTGAAVTFSNNSSIQSSVQTEDQLSFCTVCQITVHVTSKHCRLCNRCIYGFDHHCKWANNCIARNNYASFIWLLCSVCSASSVILAAGIKVLVEGDFSEKTEEAFNTKDSRGILAGAIVTMVISGCVTVHCCMLLSLHLFLKCKGLTTYEFIVLRRKSVSSSEKTWNQMATIKSQDLSNETFPIANRELKQSFTNRDVSSENVKRKSQEEIYWTAR